MNASLWDLLGKAAAIVGLGWAIIMVIRWFKKWIMNRIDQNKLKSLEGKWYEYHWTNPGGANAEFKWLGSTLEAKSGIFSSYTLTYINDGVLYQGTARYIDKRSIELIGDILLKLQSKNKFPVKLQSKNEFPAFKETIYFRYNIPERQIGDNNDEIAGIWLSYNFGKDITSGASILSKNVIPLRELDAKFEEYFEIKNASIVVKNNGTSDTKKPFWKKLIGK